MKKLLVRCGIGFIIFGIVLCSGISCQQKSTSDAAGGLESSLLSQYMIKTADQYSYELYKIIEGDGYKTHILKMISGRWLTTAEVRDPVWWHWLRIIVPDTVSGQVAMLFIGGGDRDPEEPGDVDKSIREVALNTHSIVTSLHNIPNQAVIYTQDKKQKPRKEDDLIAYAWREFMVRGAKQEDAEWLPRFPMTRGAVRAMDAVSDYIANNSSHVVHKYVVAGGSKRGWTTWTTAVADDRVIAIAPIVIDLLNIVPSFRHHWRAYGHWSNAVDDYVHHGIMDWMGSQEFEHLLKIVEPYSFRTHLTLPKMLLNGSGDEFFLPDSWQFYWKDLVGEKHIRYVANSGHGMDGTDALETLISFYHCIITNTPRPDFDWSVKNGVITIQTNTKTPPEQVTLWQAHNEKERNFRIDEAGEIWTSKQLELSANGHYTIKVDTPEMGWKAFFAELTFPGPGKFPFKQTTGVVVVPDKYDFSAFQAKVPLGTHK